MPLETGVRKWERPKEDHHTPGDWRILYGDRTDIPEEPLEPKEDIKPTVHYLQVVTNMKFVSA